MKNANLKIKECLFIATFAVVTAISGFTQGNLPNKQANTTCQASKLTSGDTIRILPLGNSITQSNNEHYSYRYNLWKKLIDTKIVFDFAGSMNTNYKGNPVWPSYKGKSFDPDNEGHWGVTTDFFVKNLSAYLLGYTPDIVLFHLGTNDVGTGIPTSTSQDNLTFMISKLREKNPNVIIFLSKIIPRGCIVPIVYNNMIAQLAPSLSTAQSPVILVDQSLDFDTVSDTFDGTHPNAKGEEKMAQKWFDAIMKYKNSML